jgi:hypothetical protein
MGTLRVKRKLLWSLLIVVATVAIALTAVTNLYTGLRADSPFIDAHERAVRSFVKSEGFGISRFKRKDLWNDWSVQFEGASCRTWGLHLIGLTAEKGQRYFEGRPPKKTDISSAEHRKLDDAERGAAQILLSGNVQYVKIPTTKDDDLKSVRVLAPIRALQSCLKCHQGKVGDVLGAIDYQLVPQSNAQ